METPTATIAFKNGQGRLLLTTSKSLDIPVHDILQINMQPNTRITLYELPNFAGKKVVLFNTAPFVLLESCKSAQVKYNATPLVYEVMSHHQGIKYWVQLPEIAMPDIATFNIHSPVPIAHRRFDGDAQEYSLEPFIEGLQIVKNDRRPIFQLRTGSGNEYNIYAHLRYDRNCYFPERTSVKAL